MFLGIRTHCSLDQATTAILIFVTQHRAKSQIFHGKLKILEFMLHNFMDYDINHISSFMIMHIPFN